MTAEEAGLSAEEQAAFDRIQAWFPGTTLGGLEPHTDETRRLHQELLAEQTVLAQQRTLLQEADEVLAEDTGSCSWRAVNLRDHLFGRIVDEPSILVRDDQKALFYGGKRNAIFGAYESGKTFVALLSAKEVLEGGKVVWIDFEDSPRSVASRLLALGIDEGAVLERFRYI